MNHLVIELNRSNWAQAVLEASGPVRALKIDMLGEPDGRPCPVEIKVAKADSFGMASGEDGAGRDRNDLGRKSGSRPMWSQLKKERNKDDYTASE